MTSSRLVVAALVGWLLVGLLAAAPQGGSGPSPRFTMSMAFDSSRNVSVMFGGYGASGFLGDTWEWDGSAWHERTPTNSPTPREASMMAFDASRGVCVLFGGVDSSGNHPGDTWEWDGQDWSLVATGGAGGRRNGDMVFDAVKGVCVMHGGYNGSWLNDTWEWDGASWNNVSSSNGMSVRNAHRMAFDRARGVTVLYGGNFNGYNDETWEWDGATWSLINPTSPPGNRAIYSMCYDVVRQRVVMFGGRPDFNSESDETWEWDGTDWTLVLSPRSPIARHGASCVYDESRDEVVLFGGRSGSGFLGDTWVFDGLEWQPKLDYVTSPVNGNRYALTPPMTWQEAEDLAVLEGGHLATVRSSAEHGWLEQTFGASANPRLWIGLNDFGAEGVHLWSSGESLSWTNWDLGSGEPNNGGVSPRHRRR
ncbi:hypothetical protein N9B90_02115 [bacterium]|nr:hypothetical protein [bacterium]